MGESIRLTLFFQETGPVKLLKRRKLHVRLKDKTLKNIKRNEGKYK
jgi:hypothetical protein